MSNRIMYRGAIDPQSGSRIEPREIDLGSGLVTIVDEDDFEFVQRHHWRLTSSKKSCRYAHGLIKGRIYLLHRLIVRARPDEQVDHINRDGLDNRKSNLRLCNANQNVANRRDKTNRFGFRGVRSYKSKFFAEVRSYRKAYYGPHRDKVLDAARDYDEIAARLHGEFAFLNFPVQP